MTEVAEIEVPSNILPKEVTKDIGTVKLFNKWDYDVEVRDISLTYVYTNSLEEPLVALRDDDILGLILTD